MLAKHDSKRNWSSFAGIMVLACAGVAQAQTYPTKPVRLLIGVPPGGFSDVLARTVAAEMSKGFGQSIVVESRAGASDAVVGDAVAKAAPDGYTLYQANDTVLMVNALLRKNLPFNTLRDFKPVAGLITISTVLVTRGDLPANNLQEFVALAKRKPGELNFGSFGVGSAAQFDAEKLNQAAGIRTTHVPYRGGTEQQKALLAGEIDYGMFSLPSFIGLIKQGKVKALAWGGRQRNPVLPDVPTLRESGFDFNTGGWFGLFAPAGTPDAVAERVAAEAGKALATPLFRERFLDDGSVEPLNIGPAAFARLMQKTLEDYKTLTSRMDIKLE
jgi:tripartite-type tricarboxylate transporter receptor subunit TctC